MSDVEVIFNMDFMDYLKLDRLSSTALKDYSVCADYYKWRKENPMKETDAMRRGTMIHTLMLENHRFQNDYYVVPSLDKRSKDEKAAYKAYVEAANGRILVSEEEMNKFKHLPARNDTKNETTVLFEIEGVPCKSRFDMTHFDAEGNPIGIEDLKTIADIENINRDVKNRKYYLQAGFYSIAFHAAYGRWPEFFKFNFVSTGDYVANIVCPMEFEYYETGRMMVVDLIDDFKESVATDTWPKLEGFPLEMPNYL